MIVNQANVAAMYRGFNVLFQAAFQETEILWNKIASEVPSTGKDEVYTWLKQIPGMKEWIGDKDIKSVALSNWTVKNKDWESTIEVDRNDIDDDKLGVYTPLIQMLGAVARQHPDELMTALLNGAFTQICFDGQYFCDTDHPYDGGVQSNKGTAALAAASYGAARAAMRIIKGDESRILRINPRLLIVDPTNESIGKQILTAEKDTSGATNIHRGTAELLVLDGLTAGYWFLADNTKPVKALILQMRKMAQMVQQTDVNADNVFMRKKFRYGAEGRYNAAYGLWQLIWGSNGTT